ncbi:MAG: hypothetical protein VX438_10590, partial [Planctomycetota bacterium]|nr:hypothetical protein [Planctomycetota bacterium]
EKSELENQVRSGQVSEDAKSLLLDLETQIEFHRTEHLKYKPDDSARQIAVPLASEKYPWARQASQGTVVYDLQRDDAFELEQMTSEPKPK